MNKLYFVYPLLFLLFSFFQNCKKEDVPELVVNLELEILNSGTTSIDLSPGAANEGIPFDGSFVAQFNKSVDTATLREGIYILDKENNKVALKFNTFDKDRLITLEVTETLTPLDAYQIYFTDKLKGMDGAAFASLNVRFSIRTKLLVLEKATAADTISLLSDKRVTNVPLNLALKLSFDQALNKETITGDNIRVSVNGSAVPISFSFNENPNELLINADQDIEHFSKCILFINDKLKGINNETYDGFSKEFHSALDSTPKFPIITDDELLLKIQKQTFNYFWDFAHPASGLIKERNTSSNLVTTGGSGFGLMTILVGIKNGFITRDEGTERLGKMINFLNKADRFHGVWPHWMNGTTGEVIPFSSNDDGGDLVETAFLAQGLLTVRQFLDPMVSPEKKIIDTINKMWDEIEWDWYTQGGEDVLYWHWSPNYEWEKNLAIRGWNEALIIYVLAAGSSNHGIDADVYNQGWAKGGNIKNGNEYYGIELPLGSNYGGPMFFAHYSFLALDPRNLSDTYANYWTQNKNHSLINRAHCIQNPYGYVAYSNEMWGLTASDGNTGYSAHSPTNDRGVISPTAAISSIPYTPEESMEAIRFFYYVLGDKLWGDYGFYDAFNSTENWYASSTLAIDQGPIIIMIENYKTQYLWNLFMSAPEVQTSLDKLEFTY